VLKARESLRKDTIELVAQATATVLKRKVDTKADSELITSALKEAK
jgi:F0F1-type ATP synthase membrane subunit b/b'